MSTMKKSSVLLIHHAAERQHPHPPNSIRGLQVCLDAGSRVIEMDVSPLADGNFSLLHGPSLDEWTNGSGPVSARTTDEIRELRLTRGGTVTDEPVALLNQALELLSRHPHPTAIELQLDLKPYTYLDDAALSRLVATLETVKDRVRVTSEADWTLRRLRTLDADLPLGFDPALYLDARSDTHETEAPPIRVGAYGYWDDHPLASRRWGNTATYLAARAEALWAQSPPGAVWYIRATLLARVLNAGFDWIAHLHARGVDVDAWTLNPDRPEHIALARRLMLAGVDRITTNDAPTLAKALGAGVEF